METSFEDLDDLIILKIFSYLTTKTLCRSMCVNKKWNLFINEVLGQRKKHPETIMFKSENWSVNNIMEIHTFKNEFENELEKLNSIPSLAVFFLNRSSSLPSFLDIDDNKSETGLYKAKRIKISRKKYLVSSLIKRYLSSNIEKLFIYGDGVIGIKNKQCLEIESDYELPAFSGIFIPKNDSFRFSSKPEFSKPQLPLFKTEDDFDKYLGIKDDEELKFILVLIDGYSDSKLVPILSKLNELRKLKEKKDVKKSFACSGGIVKRIDNGSDQRPKLIFISLISKKAFDMKVSQIVVREQSQPEFRDVWNEKISLMQKTGVYQSNENYLGFQVSCCGRGKEYHNEENLESNLFLKTFPNVPLIGFFGYGEIGVDYLPDYTSHDTNINLLDNVKNRGYAFEDIITTGFTSIFTLISFKT